MSAPRQDVPPAPPRDAASNEIYRLPPRLFDLRCRACWIALAAAALVIASFATLDLHLGALASRSGAAAMARFGAEFFPPDTSPAFLRRIVQASGETVAMSALGTLLAAGFGWLLALPAARTHVADRARWRTATRGLLNALRAIPELVWASMLLVAAGLGPMAGTLALALHTTGVLGRLFAEAVENAPPGPAFALRAQGAGAGQVLLYATLPQVAPQLLSYTLYRWENNIRAAAILGVVGAGGLGQMLSFHLGLFQMAKACTVLLAMLVLVLGVDGVSYWARRRMTR
jgi:phosphonate transport system permease protein